MSKAYDAIIIGAGPTGLITANLLGLYNVKTLVIEKNSSISDIPKAILIDDETLRICQTIGLVDEVNKIITVGGGANYYSKDWDVPFTHVKPKTGKFGYYPRNKFLQHEFERILLEGLDRFPHVDVKFNTTLQSFQQNDNMVIVQLNEGKQLHAKYLLGCDGGKSTVRKQLGISFQDIGNKKNGSSFEEPWIILDLKNDTMSSRHTSFYCDPPRPSMNSATAKGQRRFEFMLLPGEDEEEMLTDESIAKLVEPFTEYKIENVVKKAIVTFNALIAEKFQSGNVLILGDAAHLTPPFAGQGLNSGIRDAFNVSWKIAAVVKGDADTSIVDSYQGERKEHVEAMIKLAVRMGNFILTTSRKRKLLRDFVFGFTSLFPPLKRYITEMRFKPKPICKEGVFVDIESDPIIGSMIPQPEIMDENVDFKLLDEVIGHEFALLKIGDPDVIQFPKPNHPIWEKIVCHKVTVLPEDFLPHSIAGEKVITDIHGTFKQYIGKFILLRPDRYVAGVFSENDFDHFSKQLDHLYSPKQSQKRHLKAI